MTDTDKELARQWAADAVEWVKTPRAMAAARYILATLARPEIGPVPAGCGIHPFSSAACSRGTQACVVDHDGGEAGQRIKWLSDRLCQEEDDHRKALKEVERLTKERETLVGMALNPVALKPAAEDAELDEAVTFLRTFDHTVSLCTRESATHFLLLLLAARVKELRRG